MWPQTRSMCEVNRYRNREMPHTRGHLNYTPVQKVACMKTSWHESFMHDSDISMHENKMKFPCMNMKTLPNNFHG